MALVHRTSGRRGGTWWLAVGVVLTLLVLFVDVAYSSRSRGRDAALTTQAWVDRVLPVITQSNDQGALINRVRAAGTSLPAATVMSQLDRVAAGADSALRTARGLHPPASAASANAALLLCLQTRAQAAGSLAVAMTRVLTGPQAAAGAAAPAITAAGQQLAVADQAYRLFVHDMPRVGVHLPASAWYTDPSAYAQPGLTNYLQSLRAATSAAPVHDVAVDAVTTDPPALGSSGGVQVLPPAGSVTVTATVADVGNQRQPNVTVTAAVAPGAPGAPSSVRTVVSLAPGQAQTVVLRGLRVPSRVAVKLTVTAGPVAGETKLGDNSKVLAFKTS